MRGVDVIANILKAEGVEHISCFPHSEIIDAAASVGIRPILARTERTAIHIAEGYSRMSAGRKIGVATVQYGPGSENAFGSIAQAYADAAPILFLPTGYPTNERGTAPNFDASLNLRHITKWGETANQVERIPQMMQHAFSQVRNGKGAPVMLETPVDVGGAEYSGNTIDHQPARRSAPHADPKDVAAALDALLAAKTPVIVAGQGVLYAQATNELIALAERLQAPVMTTLNGKSAFPENHPLALGTGGLTRTRMVNHFLAKADFVLGLGTSFTRSDYTTAVPHGKLMVQVTNTEADIAKDYPIAYGVIGDVKNCIEQMCVAIPDAHQGPDGVAQEVKSEREAFMAEWTPKLTSDEEPINPYRVIWDLMHSLDRKNTVVTHESGNPRDQIVPFYETLVPHGYMGWGKSTQLGTSLGLAMGAKLAKPDWLSVNIMGDSAFGMVGMDFETAVRSELPIMTVILNNRVMGGYAHHLPVATEKYRTNELSGDYAKVGEGLGGYTERVEKAADLKPAFERGIAQTKAGRAVLLEVITREELSFAN